MMVFPKSDFKFLRDFLWVFWIAIVPFHPGASFAAQDNLFESVVEKAKILAASDYQEAPPLDNALQELNYDQYRAITPGKESVLWADKQDCRFRLQFFHSGYLFKRAVKMNLVDPETLATRPASFDPAHFDYSKLVLDPPKDIGKVGAYAGFRITHPLHDNPENFDEIGSFLGSSYFRLLGRDQRYGISARGLALNVAHHKAPEEFPEFVEYWIVEPRPGDETLTFYALLDSKSVAGAYRFEIYPGTSTDARIEVALFFRNPVESIGMAPLTSMFWYGENSAEKRFHDWRPEVHDSDGLIFRSWNDETVWRPLFNSPGRIRFSFFNTPDVKGFGLMQRDRDFRNYQDLQNPYHLTPTAWIEPHGKWGEGAVRLVELPTTSEVLDNIVSFFEPRDPPRGGHLSPFRYGYTLSMKKNDEDSISPERVEATRVGVDVRYPDTRRFVLDFNGPNLKQIPADGSVYAEISSGNNGFVNENQCFKNVITGGWRVEFKLDTDDDNSDPVELRCLLRDPKTNQILSETWSYQWNP